MEGKKIVNEATGIIDMGKVAVVAPQQNNEAIVNKGSIKVGTLEAGVATVKNEKDLEVTNALALEGKLVNTSTATKLKLADAAVTGELANDAMTGVDVATLNVNGAGKVTGQGKMTVAGALTVTENASFAQNELDVAATVTNGGTMNVTGTLHVKHVASSAGTLNDDKKQPSAGTVWCYFSLPRVEFLKGVIRDLLSDVNVA